MHSSNGYRDIVSKTPKSKKVLHVSAWLLFLIEVLTVIFLIVSFTVSDIIPLKYIFIIIILLGISTAVHMRLVSGRRRLYFKRSLSIFLSIFIILGSFYAMLTVGVVKTSLLNFVVDKGETEANHTDVTKKPFFVYLSGMDNTSGSKEIPEKGLSDVNMIIAVDPQNAKILMVSVPRDYYVPLWGEEDKYDKLTHAGRFGVECSMKSLENVFEIDFNYYVKVNFRSVYDIVNAVGGVDVVSEYNFRSKYSYTRKVYSFVKGENHLTGDSALAFARERQSFAEGDRIRGKHQQVVIKAIIDKMMSPSMLTPKKIGEVLDCVTKNTKTNMSHDEITDLVKFELDKLPQWDVQSLSVDGTGASKYTYSYPRQRLYVMEPDPETVETAKQALLPFTGVSVNSQVSSSNKK